MARHAIICGASIGGLFAAAALHRIGWSVDIYERSTVELSGRGAGIVTHPQLTDALQKVGADITDLGVETSQRVAFARDGRVVSTLGFDQIVTSWDRLHKMLRGMLPDGRHHLGKAVAGYDPGEAAVVRFEDGGHAEADLVIGADGFRSAVRAQMLPQVQPEYSGYVVWRALADEADLSDGFRAHIFGRFGLYLPVGQQVVGYPIAGAGNDLRVGRRRYNFVWYTPVDRPALADMLTDATGQRHAVTIPPPMIRDRVLADMQRLAQNTLPAPFVEVLRKGERPFFTPIYDLLSPEMAKSKVALLGDAACVARPHVGMGVTKAAQDALTLAGCLDQMPVTDALAAYSASRIPAACAAYERARWLGACIFEAPATGGNADGRSNPNLDAIMRLTAVADF